MRRSLNVAVTSALVVATLFAATSQAHANPTPNQGGVGCGPAVKKITNVRPAGTEVRSPVGPQWMVSAIGPGPLSLTKLIEISNSVSGSGGLGVATVSANLGFSVTASTSAATNYSINVPAGRTLTLRADAVYAVTKFDWRITQTCNVPGAGSSSSGTGTAYKFTNLRFRSY
jgi:hypothetical protein